jgi:ribosome-associated translation inhibitor RaiA
LEGRNEFLYKIFRFSGFATNTMRFTLRVTHLELTAGLHGYVQQKILGPLLRRFSSFVSNDAMLVELELARETKHHRKGNIYRALATITMPSRRLVHSETHAGNIHSAIDRLGGVIWRSIEQYKDKTTLNVRRKARRIKLLSPYSSRKK